MCQPGAMTQMWQSSLNSHNPYFTGKEPESQRGQASFPRSHRGEELGLKPRCVAAQTQAIQSQTVKAVCNTAVKKT